MKNNSESRQQIVQRFVSKSHQIMEDIAKLSVQIQATYPGINMYMDEMSSFAPKVSAKNSKRIKN